ncbi:flagellar biosynthetic protein FliO [Microbacterium sp. zg.Y1090]|uniref:flagellar biosynthetic protein FliO n=1 Tax=Microbacterium TaxID=33882 RepID=UPI00214CC5B2|nr:MULTISPECIES: flagellar biosynthetic protein FliO [unclassified Microbacterium]MCR2813991.1 flagellar biosynthetic protein FliO [Microbacterium sp. zg.Y1084]MCR2819265.1 flagellar biosynthetic protein FliO [Microbacterium sp. zg.Y1090]MDL5487182.1 flagellar biosynthetic protein FliO [Microbacterium sp. zg-Y1211]WIM28247.1 flagellar biosynthetic protein FliO [Microbacterium sp. zg-Y1090]
MLGALWFIQRRLTRGTVARRPEQIRVVARQGLGGKARVVVIEAEGTRYVLGVTEAGVSVIDSRPALDGPVAVAVAVDAPSARAELPSGDGALNPPLPLRRSRQRGHSAPASLSGGAAEALRRALGA